MRSGGGAWSEFRERSVERVEEGRWRGEMMDSTQETRLRR